MDGVSGDVTMPLVVAEHLNAHREMTLFCRDESGGPIGYPMMMVGCSGQELYFSTYAKSAKVRHLERDARVAVLAMTGHDRRTLSWVKMTGLASIWAPAEHEIDELFGEGREEQRVPSTMAALVRQRTIEGKRIVLRVMLEDPEELVVQESSR